MKERNDFYGFTVIPNTREHEPYSESPPFLVEGILHHTVTLIYGEAKSGKSTLAAALAMALSNGEHDFLGRKITLGRPARVGVIAGDFGDDEAYADWLQDADIAVYGLDRPPERRVWEGLQLDARQRHLDVVIVDNLTSFVNGSLNDDVAVNQVYDQLDRFVRDGIAVLLVAHKSEKFTEHGKAKHPLGSSAISARARWLWHVEPMADTLRLTFSGNGSAPHEVTVTPATGEASFRVLSTADSDELTSRRRNRSKARLDRDANIAAYWRANCQGMTQREAAEKIAAEFGGSPATHQSKISRIYSKIEP
jgi:hypothetical protein